MSEAGLVVETELPILWEPGRQPMDAGRGNVLLLRMLNLQETTSHEGDMGRWPDRLEAKLDLIMHWLGQTLADTRPPLDRQRIRLDAGGAEWLPAAQFGACGGILSLQPVSGLAATLSLPALLVPLRDGRVRAEFAPFDQVLADQWGQWLFRLHRRAIQSVRREAG